MSVVVGGISSCLAAFSESSEEINFEELFHRAVILEDASILYSHMTFNQMEYFLSVLSDWFDGDDPARRATFMMFFYGLPFGFVLTATGDTVPERLRVCTWKPDRNDAYDPVEVCSPLRVDDSVCSFSTTSRPLLFEANSLDSQETNEVTMRHLKENEIELFIGWQRTPTSEMQDFFIRMTEEDENSIDSMFPDASKYNRGRCRSIRAALSCGLTLIKAKGDPKFASWLESSPHFWLIVRSIQGRNVCPSWLLAELAVDTNGDIRLD